MKRDELQDGGYYYQHEGVVRVTKNDNIWGVQYVQIVAGRPQSGGYSSWIDEKDIRPITDPYQLAASKAFEAKRLETASEQARKQAAEHARLWQSVMDVLAEAKQNAGGSS